MRPEDLKWSPKGNVATVLRTIPHYLKIDDGMVARLSDSGRKVWILKSTKEKRIVFSDPITKQEQQGEIAIAGARTYTLSRPV